MTPGGEAERLGALSRTGLSAAADPALDRFARIVQRQLGVPVALVSLVDSTRQFFPGLAGLTGWAAEGRQTPLSHSFCQHVVALREAFVVEDARTDPRVQGNLALRDLGVVGYAGMPLTDGAGRVLGSLCAIDTEPRRWTEAELEALRDIAEACSAQLRVRELLTEAETARADALRSQAEAEAAGRRLAVLAESSRVLVSSLDFTEALRRLTALIVPELADWSMAYVAEGGEIYGRGLWAHRDPALEADLALFADLHPRLATEGALIHRVARTGNPVLVPVLERELVDAGTTSGEVVDVVTRLGVRSVIVVALRGRASTMGVLLLARGADRASFTSEDLVLTDEFGRRAGIALENAQLYLRQRSAAEVLQRSMLTQLPEPDHLQLVAHYQPAAHEVEVGGDWYDAFLQPNGDTMLVIGDVVGHDIAAAATMGQLRNLLRGGAYDSDSSPAVVLARLDATIAGLGTNALATATVARVEQTAAEAEQGLRRLKWSTAGHPPPMLVGADGEVRVLDSPPDLLLGVDHTSPRFDHEVVLPEGATAFFYTDGLVERRGADLADGLDRLRALLPGTVGMPLQEAVDGVLAALVGDNPEDDIAILALRAFPEDRPKPVGE